MTKILALSVAAISTLSGLAHAEWVGRIYDQRDEKSFTVFDTAGYNGTIPSLIFGNSQLIATTYLTNVELSMRNLEIHYGDMIFQVTQPEELQRYRITLHNITIEMWNSKAPQWP